MRRQRARSMRGLTLVELLVAMLVGLLLVLAAISALVVARTGFTAVDAAAQLRENARFASALLQRLGVQAGFRDVGYVTTRRAGSKGVGSPRPEIFGFDNAMPSTSSQDTSVARASGAVGYGSDVLQLRYQPTETFPGSGIVDASMIDCAGVPSDLVAIDRDDRRISILYVTAGIDGEPTLMCMRSASGQPPYSGQPLVRGVETFQVLYGVDGVRAGSRIDATDASMKADSVPDRFLRASDLTVPGDEDATRENWRRVRALRIGMVLRGDPGSAPTVDSTTLFPLGGAAYSSTADVGARWVSPADRRLRQVATFTIHLRNDQGL